MGLQRALGSIFFVLRGGIDPEWVFIDGSDIRAHQHASGVQHGAKRAIGLLRGGLTTKIHLAADAHGNPIDFEITGGEAQDATVAHKIINQAYGAENVIADKGYSDEIRQHIRNRSAIPIIPRRSNSIKPNPEFDSHLYKHRHLVENLFARRKHLRGIATRLRNYLETTGQLFIGLFDDWVEVRTMK